VLSSPTRAFPRRGQGGYSELPCSYPKNLSKGRGKSSDPRRTDLSSAPRPVGSTEGSRSPLPARAGRSRRAIRGHSWGAVVEAPAPMPKTEGCWSLRPAAHLENRRRGATSSVGSNPTPAARTATTGLVELDTRRRARRVRSRQVSPDQAVARNQAKDSQSPDHRPHRGVRAGPQGHAFLAVPGCEDARRCTGSFYGSGFGMCPDVRPAGCG
jgi:hypothetical protein